MINYTLSFKKIVDDVLIENDEYFKNVSKSSFEKILGDLNIEYSYTFDTDKIINEHIKNFILDNNKKESRSIDMERLNQISKQLNIEYLEESIETNKNKLELYYSLSNALSYHNIYKNGVISSFCNNEFWKKLVKFLHSLNLAKNTAPKMYENESLKSLIDSKIKLKDKLNEDIDIIDGEVVFKKRQENKIITKIEKKLSQLNLFDFLNFIFLKYENKRNDYPYKYTINLLIKNIHKSKHKYKDEKKYDNIFELIESFIALYQLKTSSLDDMFLTVNKLNEHLIKQVMCMNFYPINKLKTKTLLEYIDNLIKPNIDEKKFYAAFGFGIQDLTEFFNNINNISDYRYNIIELNESNTNKKILDLFYVNANEVNKDYGTKDLSKVENIFALNPIIKYKNSYYLIGFEYFKMNFYNTLVEKIIKKLDKDINRKIGTSIDSFVKSVFDKKLFTTFSGKYKVSKGQELESDLAIELTNDIILIENKNKYLTNISFSGNGSHILKDYIYSFVFSQTQLLKHEKNLRKHQQLSFNDGKVLYYNNKILLRFQYQQIIGIV